MSTTSQQQLLDYTKTAYRACARVRKLLLHALRSTQYLHKGAQAVCEPVTSLSDNTRELLPTLLLCNSVSFNTELQSCHVLALHSRQFLKETPSYLCCVYTMAARSCALQD
jgi:hypothetical protein